jgi:hypothetical protein
MKPRKSCNKIKGEGKYYSSSSYAEIRKFHNKNWNNARMISELQATARTNEISAVKSLGSHQILEML